jgi:hypothetical protein
MRHSLAQGSRANARHWGAATSMTVTEVVMHTYDAADKLVTSLQWPFRLC